MSPHPYIKPHGNTARALLVSCAAPRTGREYQDLLIIRYDSNVDLSEMNRILRRLAEMGLLTAADVDGDPIGRKCYIITPTGEEAATRVYNLMHQAAA